MKKLSFLVAFFLVLFDHTPAKADWINFSGAQNAPNIAVIHINKDRVQIDLEIYVDDIVTFDRLIPDDFFEGSDIKRPPMGDRMRGFSDKDFQVITDKGEKLQATLKMIEPRMRKERPSPTALKVNPYTGQPIPGPPEDKRVLYAKLVYPFKKKPDSLTIIPPLDEGGKIGKVPIGFLTYHLGVPLHDFKYLAESSTVVLNWEDPWYSAYEAKYLRRWQRGGVMSFLHIEPYEVRHEILARVKDLSAWIDLGLQGNEFIEVDEHVPLKKRIGQFFLEQENVVIDGKQLRPILDHTSFVKYSPTASTFVQEPEKLPIDTTMVGVIIAYLTDGIPQEVTSKWNLWSDRIQKVPTDVVDPTGSLPFYVTPDNNVLTWTNALETYQIPTVVGIAVDESMTTMKVPLASVLCLLALLPMTLQIRKRRQHARPVGLHIALLVLLAAGIFLLHPVFQVSVARPAALAPEMTDEDAVAVLDSLLKNIYRSFDFREEEDVYDRLATSVSGGLLSDIYLQNRKSLVVTQAGNAQARVKEVEVIDVDVRHLDDRPVGLLFRASWTAMGSVGHWGHVHIRKNQYNADITVEPVGGTWKITDLELLEEKRVDGFGQPKV